MKVRAKKHLGQHFLKDNNIAEKIVRAVSFHEGYENLLEIGPGTGILSTHLTTMPLQKLVLMDLDQESIDYLQSNIQEDNTEILFADFLKYNIQSLFQGQFGIIGNFPYNISSQIFFKLLENKSLIPELVGMIQKEVAERICANEGSKTYGILSVLVGAFYERELLFNVSNSVFIPPPKVESAVIRLKRKESIKLDCDEKLFFKVVKQGFQNRRKTLRNALKSINLPEIIRQESILNLRAEQLSIHQFIHLTQKIEAFGES